MGEAISSVAGTHEVVDDWGDRDDGGGNNYDHGIKCEAGDAGTDVYENMISFFKVFFLSKSSFGSFIILFEKP